MESPTPESIIRDINEDLEKRFKEAVPLLQELINKRRNSWTLTSVMEFQDVASIILTNLYQNFRMYDPTRPLDRWANTVISNRLHNLIRDNLVRYLKPCLAANSYGACCSFNLGGNKCAWTKTDGSGSGIQDSSCKFYAAWEKKKQAKHAIATPLSLDDEGPDPDSSTSLHSTLPSDPGNFIDFEDAKKVIDREIVKKLNKEEATVYRLLYIKHLEPAAVGKKMGYKKQQNSDIPGYLTLRKLSAKFENLAQQIIRKEGLTP